VTDLRSGSAPPRRWLAPIFVAVVVWRVALPSPIGLWRDWILILSLYGIYACVASRPSARREVPLAVLAYLLGIYIHGQYPYVLAGWGLFP